MMVMTMMKKRNLLCDVLLAYLLIRTKSHTHVTHSTVYVLKNVLTTVLMTLKKEPSTGEYPYSNEDGDDDGCGGDDYRQASFVVDELYRLA